MSPQNSVLAPDDHPEVIVRRSARRTKTVSAHFSGEDVILSVPQRATHRDIERWKATLVPKVIARRRAEETKKASRSTDSSLETLARELSRRYLDAQAVPTRVVWSTRQNSRWGSATPATGAIRISSRLQEAPQWVLETVVLHELVHLLEAHHNQRFWEMANRHPRARDAAQFLDGIAWADAHRAARGS